ncbi:substrate-binding domain-containing protein [Aquabacterium sp. A7-Y]|uniref:LacI family DNA-binding transcriptional regulator n=1 Tax=Aquabacterium sp. A7-Y TaxID=1349605 RepID=UPI00223E6BEA|nr:substrate-binding domain-containing protein [Aquabacterium sp. A7-Y]MCW7541559.1 substrate-binding domain-containing protein [Aquabacterium sp. A7-Y]
MNTKAPRSRPASGSVTTVEVARAAGVSVATVSRFLSGANPVSEAKREAIEAAIAQLDFKPNLLARSLKRGRSMTVGVLTQDVNSPFFTETVLGAESALEGTGYEPLIASVHWNPKQEADRIRRLIARKVDGVLVLVGSLPDAQLLRLAEDVPIVATGRHLRSPRAWGLRLDNEQGGYLATRHLLDLGHRQIAHIQGQADSVDARDRVAGYRRALEEFGLPYDKRLVMQGNFSETGGLLAMNRLLDGGHSFTAVFAANDQTAYGARLALYRRGVRVPEDVSLIGFDDLPASVFTTPPLTTVRQPMFDIGRLAARVLVQLIEGQRPEVELPGLSLVVRETTGRLR